MNTESHGDKLLRKWAGRGQRGGYRHSRRSRRIPAVQGRIIRKIPEDRAIEELIKEIGEL